MRLEFAQSRVRLRDDAAGSLAMMGNYRTVTLSWRLQSNCTMYDKPAVSLGPVADWLSPSAFPPLLSYGFML